MKNFIFVILIGIVAGLCLYLVGENLWGYYYIGVIQAVLITMLSK